MKKIAAEKIQITIIEDSKMRKTLFLISLVLVVSGCASNEPAPESDDSIFAAENAKPYDVVALSEQSEVICKTERVTGSRIGVRVCRTRAQIEAERKESREHMRRMNAHPAGSPSEG